MNVKVVLAMLTVDNRSYVDTAFVSQSDSYKILKSVTPNT